jgi:hypothetical protein
MSPMRMVAGSALVCCALLAGSGCEAIKAIMVQAAPTSEKVQPEFNRLAGKKVLIYVWTEPNISWDYPKIQLDIASYVGGYLQKNVKNITLIEPARVESYLEEIRRYEADSVEVGKHFGAEMVIHLSVYQFSMRDPGMAHYYRGNMASSIIVHDLTKQPPERVTLGDVRVSVPEGGPVGFSNIRPEQIRQMTYDAFAVAVGKKFHEWERPVE